MNIFEYAMQMEKDGENFYRNLIQKTSNIGIKTILIMLADDEVKHYNTISRMRTAKSQMARTTILDDAKNIFIQLRKSDEEFDVDLGQVELYKKAQDIETASRNFYMQKADQVEKQYQKQLFLRLAEEEKKHYFLLDNIIEFVSRPQYWLENAEFCHLEEY